LTWVGVETLSSPHARVTLYHDTPPERLAALATFCHERTGATLCFATRPGVEHRDDTQVLAGDPYLYWETAQGRLRVSPGVWTNASPVNATLVIDALTMCIDALWTSHMPRTIVEIGCGMGRHASSLAQRCETYWGIDANRRAIDDARINAADVTNAHFRLGRAIRALRRLLRTGLRADVVVLHGMRTPWKRQLFPLLKALGATQVIHITPSIRALASDLTQLRQQGWRCQRILPLDTMPNTYHMMTLSDLRSPTTTPAA